MIPKLQNAWSPLVVRSDNTRVLRPMVIEPKKMSDLAAERAVKARKERRTNPKYDLQKDREYTKRLMAKSKPSTTELLAGAAADLIDGSMIGASFIPGIGLLTGTTYWGLKGAKDLSQGNYLEGALETLPFTAPLVGKGLLYAGKAANTGLQLLNSPLTGKWTLLGSTEYRLSPSMAFSGGAGLESRPVWLRETLPGMLIKSLLENGPLEKQLSRQGTISTKQLQAYINRNDVSGIDKELIGRVLLNHLGETHLDYNTLRREVLEMIPKFNRVPLTGYLNYGMERLGFEKEPPKGLGLFNELDFMSSSEIPMLGAEPTAFTFESPGISGNTKHYTGNPVGHSRTYTTKENPDILHVMESLSDWALHPIDYKNSFEYLNFNRIKLNHENYINSLKAHLKSGVDNRGKPLTTQGRAWYEETLQEAEAEYSMLLENYLNNVNAANNTLIPYMQKSFTARQLQENLKYAAESGLTKMRYPTPESAAKIEGYTKVLTEAGKTLELLERDLTFAQYDVTHYRLFKNKPHDLLLTDPNYIRLLEKHKNLEDAVREARSSPLFLYEPQHQTILKKYADFPKQYEKMFGKGTVRTVTDNKGNTWFEVDVPLRYIDGTAEMIFKEGGILKAQDGTKTRKRIYYTDYDPNIPLWSKNDEEIIVKANPNSQESVAMSIDGVRYVVPTYDEYIQNLKDKNYLGYPYNAEWIDRSTLS